MSEKNNHEELRPSKMRGVAFPKAKYGAILAVIIIIVVNLIFYKETIISFFKSVMFSIRRYWPSIIINTIF